MLLTTAYVYTVCVHIHICTCMYVYTYKQWGSYCMSRVLSWSADRGIPLPLMEMYMCMLPYQCVINNSICTYSMCTHTHTHMYMYVCTYKQWGSYCMSRVLSWSADRGIPLPLMEMYMCMLPYQCVINNSICTYMYIYIVHVCINRAPISRILSRSTNRGIPLPFMKMYMCMLPWLPCLLL